MPQTIKTVSANCQDCYRCVRKCPIDAIWVRNEQAYINAALCVACGNCVRECPQHAKSIYRSLDAVREMIASGEFVVASLDPSFAAAFPDWRTTRVPAALRRIGFSAVYEAAEGARAVAEAAATLTREKGAPSIIPACPSVVSYIEKYRHELIPHLLPIVSPMIAHGRMLKACHGERAKVVYIGPCAAKKSEAARPKYAGAINAVLTYDELAEWLSEESIPLSTCPDSGFESMGDCGAARLAPLEGGLIHAAGLGIDIETPGVLHVSGAARVIQLLDTPFSKWKYDFVELSFCRGGCVGGPCMPLGKDIFSGARDVAEYARGAFSAPGKLPDTPLQTTFSPVSLEAYLPPVDEARIEQILSEMGKADSVNRLDCGACGYASCRENAIAVARGIAEPGMCASFSRKRAERRADRIIETSPNGIVVVGMDLNIIHMNARFLRMFGCTSSIAGLPISHVVDPGGFERLVAGAAGTQEAIRMRDGMKYQELIYALPGENEMIGIYVDLSATTFDDGQMELIRSQSLKQAQELLSHQISFSQEMAHFLGKSTARTEELVSRIVNLYAGDEGRTEDAEG